MNLTEELKTAEAQVDRLAEELEHLQAILAPFVVGVPGLNSAPSHVTVAQAARICGTCEQAIRRRIASGTIQTINYHGTEMIPVSFLLPLIEHPPVKRGRKGA